jgi:hypothetical protein
VNDDSDGMKEVMNMFGTMLLTSFDMLSEHGLLAADSQIPNIGIISLLMIEFSYDSAGDLDLTWACEIVRALDKAGVELKPRKEVEVSQEKIDELREQYEDKESDEIEDGKNIYKVHASNRSWEPDDDFEDDERIWARWDWKKEVCSLEDDSLVRARIHCVNGNTVCGVQTQPPGRQSLQFGEVEQAAEGGVYIRDRGE